MTRPRAASIGAALLLVVCLTDPTTGVPAETTSKPPPPPADSLGARPARVDTTVRHRLVPRPSDPRLRVARRRHSMDVLVREVRADSVFVDFRSHLAVGDLSAAATALDQVGATERHLLTLEVAVYDRIELDFFKGDFEAARAGFDAFARDHPRGYLTNDAIARLFLIDDNVDPGGAPLRLYAESELLERTGAVDSAIAVCRRALSEFPETRLRDDLYLQLGDLSMASSAPAGALPFYQAVVDSIPDTDLGATAQMRIGRYHVEVTQDLQEALRAYEEVLERYPDSLEAPEARKIIEDLRQRT